MKLCHCLGALPPTLPPICQEEDLLLAVDGGYQYLQTWGLVPDFVVGDFDSLGYIPTIAETSKTICHKLPCQKDETDLAYALHLAQAQGYRHFLCQGVLGGRLDHSMANFQLLLGLAEAGLSCLLVGEGQCALCVQKGQDGEITFPSHFRGNISVFAQKGPAVVDLTHLLYQGKDFQLSPTVPLGVSNEFLPPKQGTVTVKKGTVLLLWEAQGSYEDYVSLLDSSNNTNSI